MSSRPVTLFYDGHVSNIFNVVAFLGEICLTLIMEQGRVRIVASTFSSGGAGMSWFDSDGNRRINAMTRPDGTVILPNSESK